jgi:hypothetical protein
MTRINIGEQGQRHSESGTTHPRRVGGANFELTYCANLWTLPLFNSSDSGLVSGTLVVLVLYLRRLVRKPNPLGRFRTDGVT